MGACGSMGLGASSSMNGSSSAAMTNGSYAGQMANMDAQQGAMDQDQSAMALMEQSMMTMMQQLMGLMQGINGAGAAGAATGAGGAGGVAPVGSSGGSAQASSAPASSAPASSSPSSSAPAASDAAISNPTQFAQAVLKALGDPDSSANEQSIVDWEKREGGNWNNTAKYNPLNTTESEPGDSSMNSDGVKAYTSWGQGVQATVSTLQNGDYSDLLSALKSGGGLANGSYKGLSTWSGGAYSSV